MGVSEKKMKIVIDNYFRSECDVNTSIKSAFEKGFRIGVIKGQSAHPDIDCSTCLRQGCEYKNETIRVNCPLYRRSAV